MRAILLLSLLTVLFTFSACEQGEGDRCETTTDCADDLVCCIPAGTLEGTCQHEENCQDQ